MSMPIQFGDLVAFAKIAFQVWEYGWSKELRSDTQYALFGRYVKSLATNTNLLVNVVFRAEDVLRSRGARPADCAIYDLQSLVEIVGDMRDLLDDCRRLLETNRRYQASSGIVGNIEWNVFVQPNADRLINRITQHNARIEHFIRPFEVDVMTRMYDHIIRKIDAVQATANEIKDLLHQFINRQDPALYNEIKSKETRRLHTVPIPEELRRAFEMEFQKHPERHLRYPSLQAISDSFVISFNKSTKCFTPGLTMLERTPPVLQYVCLLKSVFLMEKIKSAGDLQSAPPQSHWHSYIGQLEDDLSTECRRFQTEMAAPLSESVSADLITLWPLDESEDVFDSMEPQLLMDKLIECWLAPTARGARKKLAVLRHTESNDERFRLVIEVFGEGLSQQQKVIDLDIRNSQLRPIYALPEGDKGPIELILRANSEVTSLVFERLSDALKFQQALTGFRPWGLYAGYVRKAAFFANGRTIGLPCSVQLWVPDRMVGTPITSRGEGMPVPAINQSGEPFSSSDVLGPPSRDVPSSRGTSVSMDFMGTDLERPSSFRLETQSPSPPSSQHGSISIFPTLERLAPSPTFTGSQSSHIPFSPSTQRASTGANVNNHNGSIFASPLSSSPPTFPEATTLQTPQPQTSRRFSSISRAFSSRRDSRATVSTVSIRPSISTTNSSSSTVSDTTVSITTKSGARSGILHVQPLKPMMVMFTRDDESGGLSMVTISIDNATRPNPERCNCRQAGSVGKNCPVTAIEQNKGAGPIEAKQLGPYYKDADREWDVLKLAASRRGDPKGFGGADWYGLQRVSIGFRSAQERTQLVGGMCTCLHPGRPFTFLAERNCMQAGHVGLLGEVRIKYRRELHAYHNVINGIHDQVVDGVMVEEF